MKKLILLLVCVFCLSQPSYAEKMAPVEAININTATAEQIAVALDGIGLKKAQAIVLYRKQHGDFQSVDGLAAVKGIGEKTVQKNRHKLQLK